MFNMIADGNTVEYRVNVDDISHSVDVFHDYNITDSRIKNLKEIHDIVRIGRKIAKYVEEDVYSHRYILERVNFLRDDDNRINDIPAKFRNLTR
jgi:hypothetical protein